MSGGRSISLCLLLAAVFPGIAGGVPFNDFANSSAAQGMGVSGAAAPVLLSQTPPDESELSAYRGLHAAAARGDLGAIGRLIAEGADLNAKDPHGRTPLMVAAYRRGLKAARALIKAGADLNALDSQRYDVLTISGVLGDAEMVKLAIASGADTGLTTSPYDGTALIASAHLGHVEVVRALIAG